MQTIAALALAFLVAPALMLVRAKVVLALARWFLIPVYPTLALPTEWQAVGLLFLISVVIDEHTPDSNDEIWGSFLKDVSRSLFVSGSTLVLGALVHWVSLP